MLEITDHAGRIAAALRGAIAAHPQQEAGAAHDMLAVAESLADRGALDVDDLRPRQLSLAAGSGLMVRVLPFGLATPLDRPRLRRDAYRCAAAAGADEGTTVACLAAALVAADLLRFDPSTTALRVRQSLLEDAPMALLNRLVILERDSEVGDGDADPGAALQVALCVLDWTGGAGVAATLAQLGEAGRGGLGTLTAALAGAACGQCDVPIPDALASRADRAATALASLTAGAV